MKGVNSHVIDRKSVVKDYMYCSIIFDLDLTSNFLNNKKLIIISFFFNFFLGSIGYLQSQEKYFGTLQFHFAKSQLLWSELFFQFHEIGWRLQYKRLKRFASSNFERLGHRGGKIQW